MKLSEIIFYAFKAGIRIPHNYLLYRHRYVFGSEHIPAPGSSYFVVSNHQNTGNDPINLIFSMPFRLRISIMARASIFEMRSWISSFLDWLGIVPAYRLKYEGVDGLDANYKSMQRVSDRVNSGSPLIIFPEAGHTQGHYMLPYTTGTVRMAFNAASLTDWQQDIQILPAATHYSDYFDVQTDVMVRFAPPVSLKPYYEEYQQHPYRVMRRLTHQLQDTVRSMMLDEGEVDYEERDFLRQTTLNVPHREAHPLPELLEADQSFINRLSAHPRYAEVIAAASQLRDGLHQCGITERQLLNPPSALSVLLMVLAWLLLMPLWVVCLWPHLLCYKLPILLIKTDRMFTNTLRYVFSVLVIYPLCALLTFIVSVSFFGLWWPAVVWLLLLIPTARFAWWYNLRQRHLLASLHCLQHRSAIPALRELHSQLRSMLS